MRRSVITFLAAASAVVATPAVAGKSNIQTLPAVEHPCDVGLTTPDAIDCAGYYPQNWNAGSPDQIALTQEAIASLDGDFEWDGDWNAVSGSTQLAADLGGPNDDQLSFGQTLFGLTVIGAHFGNVAGPAGNVSVFWLFDFGTEGADFITLDNTGGFSNAVLYTTGTPAVPEPATWAMMLLGFGAAGTAIRRNRRRTAHIAQLA